MKAARPFALLSVLAAAGVACSSNDSSPNPPPDGGASEREVAKMAPLSAAVKLTDSETLVPSHAIAPQPISSMDPAMREQLFSQGYGAFTTGGGEAPVDRVPEGVTPAPKSGDVRKRLTRFVHLADFQLADDESPTKVANLDNIAESAFRPQEGHECRVVNAVVRTVNRIHKDAPFDFMVLGGDNADSAQKNEIDWVLALLGGSERLSCDSGDLDDPVKGANNDGKDPFAPEGLDVPWYWVTGNHDILVQGNFIVNAERIAESMGSEAQQGTRDYRQPGGPIATSVVPDANRAAQTRAQVLDRVAADKGKSRPLGHGLLGEYAQKTKKAYYAEDIGNSGIRLIVIDTAAETGGSEGIIRESDVKDFVEPELARAKADGKYVLFASHHTQDSIRNGTGPGGTLQDKVLTKAQWESLLLANPHVIGHLAGHTHVHRVRHVPLAGAPEAGHGYWEIRTSAIADYPHQFRVIEVWDEGNEYLSIRSVAVNYATENDPVALIGRQLGILDYTSKGYTGGGDGAGQGTAQDRNVVLWLKKPKP